MDLTFAEQIKEIRTTAGWSRAKVFERLSIPARTLEDWENKKRIPPQYVQKLVIDRLMLEIEKDAE